MELHRHVSRVIGATTGRIDPSLEIAKQLAMLGLPSGAVLVILSQPGDYLQPLRARGAQEHTVDGLSNEELRALAERLELLREGNGEPDALVSALMERSRGNALYATYICREALLHPGLGLDAITTIRNLPAFDGTLRAYYVHLNAVLGDGSSIADILSQLPFGVTRPELRAMWPEQAHRVDAVLQRLRPVLHEKAAQGGVRIYHESFSRFLEERFQDNEIGRAALQDRVINWLNSQELCRDARAFRYLLPMLANRGRDKEVVDLVDGEFALEAVAAMFSPAATLANLSVAIGAATRLNDWPSVLRCVELARGVQTYEDERLDECIIESVDVLADILGVETLAGRMLEDGHTRLPARPGIRMCAAIDRAGGVPPWEEYIDAFKRALKTDKTSYGASSDTAAYLAFVRGLLRVRCTDAPAVSRLVERAVDFGLPEPELAEIICDVVGPEELVSRLAIFTRPGDGALVAAEWRAERRQEMAAELATACSEGVSSGNVSRLFCLGATVEKLNWRAASESLARLRSLASTIQSKDVSSETNPVLDWLDECAIAARRAPEDLAALEVRISGAGWYRCWLRFTIALCQAEAMPAPQCANAALGAIDLLSGELNPFVGSPRACDLYYLRSTIASTLRRAVRLLDDSVREAGLEKIQAIGRSINTSLFGEMGGPIPIDLLVRLALESASTSEREQTRAFVRNAAADGARSTRYYADVGELFLQVSKLELLAGDKGTAGIRWRDACRFLLAYGSRKDATIYELLDSLERLVDLDRAEICKRLEGLQSMCLRVALHTDGKGTWRVPVSVKVDVAFS